MPAYAGAAVGDGRAVQEIARRVYGAEVASVVELGAGPYNHTNRVSVAGRGRPVILRVAPEPGRQFRSERELMRNEPATLPSLSPFVSLMPQVIAAVVYTVLARHPKHRGYADRACADALQAVKLRLPGQESRSFIFENIYAGAVSGTSSSWFACYARAERFIALGITVVCSRLRAQMSLSFGDTEIWRMSMCASSTIPGGGPSARDDHTPPHGGWRAAQGPRRNGLSRSHPVATMLTATSRTPLADPPEGRTR